jgi:hypothetical protein
MQNFSERILDIGVFDSIEDVKLFLVNELKHPKPRLALISIILGLMEMNKPVFPILNIR